MSEAASLPLAGIRVLDLSWLLAGNMLTLQPADFGADVIKVESDHGNTPRDWKNGGKSDVPDPELGRVTMHNVFPRLSRTPGRIRTPAPGLGEHQEIAEGSQPSNRRPE